MISKLKVILIVIAVIILIAVGLFYYSANNPNELEENIPEEFPYEIDFSQAENISEEQLETLKRYYETGKKQYAENPESFNALMNFAFIYYQLEDYEMARDLYIKVGENSPKNYSSFWNLGNTYVFLEDYNGAEQAYLKTIENEPKQVKHYIALADLYRHHFPEKRNQIPDILKSGLIELSGDYNLLVNLALYYKESGEKDNALKYFQQVIANYPDSAEQIQKEIDEL